MSNKNEINQFKAWCFYNGIKQIDIAKKSDVGVTTLWHLMNNGEATDKTIEKVAHCLVNHFGKDISTERIKEMIKK